jgi:hypothetical protein
LLLLTNPGLPTCLFKEKSLGDRPSHTGSIIEVHDGQIGIESELNAGTNVEVGLPTL